MGCCGQTRSLASAPPQSAMTVSAPAATVASGVAKSSNEVVLRYRQRARILVRGPVTGRPYVFSVDQPTQLVASRDAELLLTTQYFARG